VLYEGTKEHERAMEEFSKVPAPSTYFKEARLHMASLSRLAGRIDHSIRILEEAIHQRAQIPEFYEYLAAIHEEKMEYAEAIAVLSNGHSAIPKNEKIAFLLGVLYEKAREQEKAITAMYHVLTINPQNASALNYIGYTYAERGENLGEALDFIQRALVLKPQDGYIMDSLGWVYFKRGDLDHSLKYLLKAQKLLKEEPTILFHIGEILRARGEGKAALKAYEKALDAISKNPKREPQHEREEEEKIRQRIEELKSTSPRS